MSVSCIVCRTVACSKRQCPGITQVLRNLTQIAQVTQGQNEWGKKVRLVDVSNVRMANAQQLRDDPSGISEALDYIVYNTIFGNQDMR